MKENPKRPKDRKKIKRSLREKKTQLSRGKPGLGKDKVDSFFIPKKAILIDNEVDLPRKTNTHRGKPLVLS